MDATELTTKLKQHQKWVLTRFTNNVEGDRLVLSGANLSRVDLSGANLRVASLSEANLRSPFGDLMAKCFVQPKEVEGLTVNTRTEITTDECGYSEFTVDEIRSYQHETIPQSCKCI